MAVVRRALTEMQIRSAKPRESAYKLTDGGGLFLHVQPNGSRYWRAKYRFAGKEKLLALGVYPDVGLGDARRKHEEARRALADGRDPSAEKRVERRRAATAANSTFEAVAREWLAKQKPGLASSTYEIAERRLTLYAFPRIGDRPIGEIDAPEVLDLLMKVEARGKNETARRVKQRVSQIFRYAIATSRAKRDPTADLRGALAPVVTRSHAAITDPTEIGHLLRALDEYPGQATTIAALRLAPLVFVRPGELRGAEWPEFDVGRAEWRIPGERMKMADEHIVPLARQALAIIEDLRPLTGRGKFLFPSLRSSQRCMSEATITAALRRLGYSSDDLVAHGFRAMASTRLNEMGFAPDVIERQLAHKERSKVRASYNRALYMAERRTMMQRWADYLDTLRDGGRVSPRSRARGTA